MNTPTSSNRSRAPKILKSAYLLAIPALFLLTACTNIEAVREFAKTSSATADYTEIVSDFADSPKRIKRFQPQSAWPQSEGIIERRSIEAKRLLETQTVLTAYMNALGDLAADKLVKADAEIDSLQKALEKAKFIGDADQAVNKETATAAASLAKIFIRAATDRWRQNKTKKIIRESNAPLQRTIEGLILNLDTSLRSSLQTERVAIGKPYQAWIAGSTSESDQTAVPPIAQILLNERLDVINAKEKKLDEYIKILKKIASGHESMYQNIDNLKSEHLIQNLKSLSKDLQEAHKQILILSD